MNYQDQNLNLEVFTSQNIVQNPVQIQEDFHMMDMKFGRANHSLSTNTNCCGLFNTDDTFPDDILDCGTLTVPLPLEDTPKLMDDPVSPQFPSSSDDMLMNVCLSSEMEVSSKSYTSSDTNCDMVSSLSKDDCSASSDFDLFSMLLNEDAPLEEILNEMEDNAIKQSQRAESVKLDHDYMKKLSGAATSEVCSTSRVSNSVGISRADSTSSNSRRKRESDIDRRIRNNEASRRSRAARKNKLKIMESDVQRLAAENQRMRVLLKDMEFTAKRCKEILVSSLAKKK